MVIIFCQACNFSWQKYKPWHRRWSVAIRRLILWRLEYVGDTSALSDEQQRSSGPIGRRLGIASVTRAVYSHRGSLYPPHEWHKFHTNMFFARGVAENTEAAWLRSQLTAAPSAYLRMGMRARAMHEIRVIGFIRWPKINQQDGTDKTVFPPSAILFISHEWQISH